MYFDRCQANIAFMSGATSRFDLPATIGRSERAATSSCRRRVVRWLQVVAAMIFVMVTLGGATRLTGSGLSIMEWAPFRGVLPPLSHAEWERLFALYKGIPQYSLINDGFGIEGFKRIFWLEYLHRLWGRTIGLAFALPLLWFWAAGQIERRWRWPMVGLLLLGGAQGGVGWLMVASGFEPDATAVSPYRLVAHLVFALALYAAILWTALSIQSSGELAGHSARRGSRARRWVQLLCLLVTTTIVAGGFVAGIHAGLDYNTFPLMDGRLVPAGYAAKLPDWRNWTENVAAVQFDHRLLATVTALVCAVACWVGLRDRAAPRRPMIVLTGLVAAQYGLGVATLLWHVPVVLGTMHQANAVAVLTAALVVLHGSGRLDTPMHGTPP